jgi:hypothetical protein
MLEPNKNNTKTVPISSKVGLILIIQNKILKILKSINLGLK